MYAYAKNNPVMFVDPSGEFAITLSIALIALAKATIVASGTVITLAVVYEFSDEILDFVDSTVETVKNEFEKTLKDDYTVYSLVDDQGTIRYVGRVKTDDYRARMGHHEKNKPGLKPGPKIDDLNYWESRGVEQLGILANSTGWFDKETNPFGNKYNGVGPLNKKRFDYYGAGIRYIWNNLENEWTNLFH
jgi:hypothetical protein